MPRPRIWRQVCRDTSSTCSVQVKAADARKQTMTHQAPVPEVHAVPNPQSVRQGPWCDQPLLLFRVTGMHNH